MEKKVRYYDTHAHYGQPYRKTDFYEKRYDILKQSYEAGVVKIVNAAIGMSSNGAMIEDFANFPYSDFDKKSEPCNNMEDRKETENSGLPQVKIAIGEHPTAVGGENAACLDEAKDKELERLCSHPRVCAIKTGLDYARGMDHITRQQRRFRKLIQMSKEKKLPLVLHIREAYEDAIRILKMEAAASGERNGERKEGQKGCQNAYQGVVHCFTQGPELAWQFISMGFLLGIGGKVTYESNQELRETVKCIPLQYLVLETDCPFIPVCGSKEVNTSLDLPMIAQTIAEIKGMPLEQVAEETYRNAERVFEKHS